MRYVDAFVLPVPEKNLKAYQAIAQKAGKVWLEHASIFKYVTQTVSLRSMNGINESAN